MDGPTTIFTVALRILILDNRVGFRGSEAQFDTAAPLFQATSSCEISCGKENGHKTVQCRLICVKTQMLFS